MQRELQNSEGIFHLIALCKIRELTPQAIKRLLEHFGSPQRVFEASSEELEAFLKKEAVDKIRNFDDWKGVETLLAQLEREKIKVLTIKDEGYPSLLREIYDPPILLFYKGSIEKIDHFGLAIVGSRKASEYGRKVTEKFSFELAFLGITIVSGMARGIDSVAHRGALSADGRTIAVLGSGLLRIYPPENRNLAEKIAERGAIISEFFPEEPPRKQNFPRRNRIISGMTIGTLVTEAALKSGALITAFIALEQGKEVFAVPGNITSQNSEGVNFLIKKGAKLVQKVEDVLEEIKHYIPSLKDSITRYEETLKVDLSEDEQAIINEIDSPVTLDELVIRTKMNISSLLDILLRLELKGQVGKSEGKYFRRS